LHGTGNINVNNGDVQDNSQWSLLQGGSEVACYGIGDSVLYCEEMNINGSKNDSSYWDDADYTIWADTGDVLPDPLRHAPALWDSRLPIPMPPFEPGYVPLPDYGMAIEVDEAGEPVLDEGQYIDAGYVASSAEPITGSVIKDYGRTISGIPTMTLTPGYYPGGIRITTGNKVKMLPGVYAFGGGQRQSDGSGLYSNGGHIEAIDCMLYVTASNVTHRGEPIWGHIDLSGGNVIIHEALDPDNPEMNLYDTIPYNQAGDTYADGTKFKYIAVYQDRANRNDVHINGNADFSLIGTLYFPTAHGLVRGGAYDAGTQFIVGSLDVAGTGDITINYDGRFWTAAYRSLLVD
jgi:hypothetical protein